MVNIEDRVFFWQESTISSVQIASLTPPLSLSPFFCRVHLWKHASVIQIYCIRSLCASPIVQSADPWDAFSPSTITWFTLRPCGNPPMCSLQIHTPCICTFFCIISQKSPKKLLSWSIALYLGAIFSNFQFEHPFVPKIPLSLGQLHQVISGVLIFECLKQDG